MGAGPDDTPLTYPPAHSYRETRVENQHFKKGEAGPSWRLKPMIVAEKQGEDAEVHSVNV